MTTLTIVETDSEPPDRHGDYPWYKRDGASGQHASPLPHQAFHAMFATDGPLGLQFGMDMWAAMDLPVLLIGLSNLLGQALIFQLASTWCSLA